MNTLQDLLIILDGQQLSAGYLTPVGTAPRAPNAHDTLRALKNQFDPYTLLNAPLPGMTNQPGAPNLLFCPAWVGSLGVGQDAIFLDGVDGKLDFSHAGQPAYIFSSGGGGPVQNYSLFLPSLTPSSINAGGTFTLGIIFTVTKAGQVTAIRFYRASNASVSAYQGNIWNATTTAQLGQANFTGLNTTGWQQQALVTPVNAVPGTRYAASIFFSDGNFAYSNSNPPITTGVLQAPDGTGLYTNNATPAFPNNNQSGVNYFVDLVFQA
jgi:hypothetical protein